MWGLLAYGVHGCPAGGQLQRQSFGASSGGVKVVTGGNGVAQPRDTEVMETVSVAAGAAVAARGSLLLRVLGVLGCLGVAAIHVIDQGGLPGTKDPQYVQIMYYALEAACVAAAALLATRPVRVGWLLALGVAAGPILGYVLSRGPGLPNYTDDVGNWTEPLGVISLVVEGVLLIVAVAVLLTGRRRAA